MANTCILDIGANNGDFLFTLAARLPAMPIIGIEPIPELFNMLDTKRIELNLTSVSLKQVAINQVECQTRFNVARHADLGVSSLLDFDTTSLEKNEYWAGRTDLYFDEKIVVDVIRLDTLMEQSGLDHVSFIKIDAQGVDLNVLASFGKYLPAVDAGMLEVSTTHNSVLYQGEPLLHDVLAFLEEHNFEPYAIKSNDPACAEVNVYFIRKGLDWNSLEERLQLRGVPLYDGKHYWHVPSATPALPPEATAPIAHNEVARARHLAAENAASWARVVFWKSEAMRLRSEQKDLVMQMAEQKNETTARRFVAPAAPGDADALAAETVKLRNNAQLMEAEISALRTSTSWRVTAPLRAFKTLISR